MKEKTYFCNYVKKNKGKAAKLKRKKKKQELLVLLRNIQTVALSTTVALLSVCKVN